jgi:hypothetical protein
MRFNFVPVVATVLAVALPASVGAQSLESTPSRTDQFAFDVLSPSMEFAWTTHRIRLKLLARLGIPDEMELNTVPDRTSDWWYAQERWAYHGGPTLVINSNDYEWLESISIPVNTQIPLPFDLIVGSTRDEYLSALRIEDTGKKPSDPIRFSAGRPTHVGHSCVSVMIEFDEKGFSKRVTWESGCH